MGDRDLSAEQFEFDSTTDVFQRLNERQGYKPRTSRGLGNVTIGDAVEYDAPTDVAPTVPAHPKLSPTNADEKAFLIGRLMEQGGGWQDDANCLGTDPELFFPERGASTREAKEVCRGCVVREECLDFAIEAGEKHGIWGGLSERERRRVRRQRAQVARKALGA